MTKREQILLFAVNNKFTKEDARGALKRITNHFEREELLEEFQIELATLHSFFWDKGRTARTPEKWLELATGKEDHNPVQKHTFVTDKGIGVSTDSRRMYLIPTEKEPGFYLKGLKIPENRIPGKFPDFTRIIPKKAECRTNGYVTLGDFIPSEELGLKTVYLQIDDITKVHFNPVFIKESFTMDKKTKVKYWQEKPSYPVLFEFSDGRQAVIMPMTS